MPADLYLLKVESLQIDESVLTGESVPVSKETGVLPQGTSLAEQKNMAFMGTTVTNGYGQGVVVATGMETEFGKIARLTQEVKQEESPLKKRLNVLGRRIGEISLVIALLVVILGIVPETSFIRDVIGRYQSGSGCNPRRTSRQVVTYDPGFRSEKYGEEKLSFAESVLLLKV
ncbi:MAG: E1-E2 ATPase [Candidatus Methanoperedenaceae archaeon GB37]|nr:MAG: E1-E2 ATPase [Candidatus Methanoperedenaceae archaeon GB37]